MARFKLTIEYDGTKFKGWQVHKNQVTVQGKLIEACEKVFETPTFELYGAGRTDAGVHALGQVAHLDVITRMRPEVLRQKMNDALPPDICINAVESVDSKFHARHDAKARSYVYQISTRKAAIGKNLVSIVKERLDVEKMQQAARLFVGFKDFRSFGNDDPEVKSTMVDVSLLNVIQQGDSIFIHIIGSHFLWRMVRRVVGVLLEVGRGKISEDEVHSFLETHSNVPSHHTAPPSGLYLEHIYYGDEPLDASFIFSLNI